MTKRTLVAAAVGFVTGYGYAFVSCLVASKNLGSASSRYWDDFRVDMKDPEFEQAYTEEAARIAESDGEDMHDVLPTDDDPFREMPEEEAEYWSLVNQGYRETDDYFEAS